MVDDTGKTRDYVRCVCMKYTYLLLSEIPTRLRNDQTIMIVIKYLSCVTLLTIMCLLLCYSTLSILLTFSCHLLPSLQHLVECLTTPAFHTLPCLPSMQYLFDIIETFQGVSSKPFWLIFNEN